MLELRKVGVRYGQRWVLRDLSAAYESDMCYSIVGESGCGKSTLSRVTCGLEKPGAGEVIFEGKNAYGMLKAERNKLRRSIQLVFQDACSSLNPRWTIGKCIGEPLRNFEDMSANEEAERIIGLMKSVGLGENDIEKRPCQLSGGQQKRAAIARVLACNPSLIIFDEAVSGLDMDTKMDILNMLMDVKCKMGCTYLFITHDMEMAKNISDEIHVIEKGIAGIRRLLPCELEDFEYKLNYGR